MDRLAMHTEEENLRHFQHRINEAKYVIWGKYAVGFNRLLSETRSDEGLFIDFDAKISNISGLVMWKNQFKGKMTRKIMSYIQAFIDSQLSDVESILIDLRDKAEMSNSEIAQYLREHYLDIEVELP